MELCSVQILAVSWLTLLRPVIKSGSPQHLIELLTQVYSCISDEILPNLNPVWHGTLMAIGEGERMRHQAGQQWPERHLQSGHFPPRPAGGSISARSIYVLQLDQEENQKKSILHNHGSSRQRAKAHPKCHENGQSSHSAGWRKQT